MSMLGLSKKARSMEIIPEGKPVPTAPPLSRKAAAVAAEMETLEAELHAATLYGQQQDNRAQVAENLLVEAKHVYEDNLHTLRKENTHLLNERDKYQRDYLDIKARLDAVAAMLLGPLKSEVPTEAVAPAIEEALKEE